MPRIIHEEWRDKNADRRYPFDDRASLINSAGDMVPVSLFIDGVFWAFQGSSNLYLKSVVVTSTDVTFNVATDPLEEVVATVTVDNDSAPDLLYLVDNYGRPAGVLVPGAEGLEMLRGWPVGTHTFTYEQTQFALSAHTPTPDAGVIGFLLPDGSVVAGDVWLVGEDGVELWEQDGAIRVDIVGSPLKSISECFNENEEAAETLAARQPLRTINGVPADEYGDFQLLVGGQLTDAQILRVTIVDGGLSISGAL